MTTCQGIEHFEAGCLRLQCFEAVGLESEGVM